MSKMRFVCPRSDKKSLAASERGWGEVSALEAEIDKLVYELYGLTDDEIAVIEGKNQ